MNWLFLGLVAALLGLLLVALAYAGVLVLSFLVGNELGRALVRRNDGGADAYVEQPLDDRVNA